MSAIRVIQFTDPHLFGDIAGTLRGVNTFETLERTLATRGSSRHLRRDPGHGRPRAGRRRRLRTFPPDLRPLRQARAVYSRQPRFRPRRCATRSRAAPFELDGPADIGAWRIVLLDSVVPHQAGGHISVEMLTKLDEELGRARQRHAMVCLHHHPVAMHSRWLDNVGLANANEFWSVIDSHPQVKAVVWGHVHQALRRCAPQRAPDRHAVHLRAVPAALRPIRHRQPAARLSAADAAFQRRDRYWRAFPDCRRIRGMTFPEAMRRGLARGLAGAAVVRVGRRRAHARGETSVWVHEGRAQHRLSRRLGARAAEGRRDVSRAARARLQRGPTSSCSKWISTT